MIVYFFGSYWLPTGCQRGGMFLRRWAIGVDIRRRVGLMADVKRGNQSSFSMCARQSLAALHNPPVASGRTSIRMTQPEVVSA
jgi:hypothetical protein